MKLVVGVVAAAAFHFAPITADALCSYKGVDDAKTTVPQEFKDSKWVVKSRVLKAKDHWSDASDSWTTYEIRVIRAFKGNPPRRMRFFTSRDSGGFYMDRPWVKLPAGHDIGGDYLLFLNPTLADPAFPAEAVGTVSVNYPCGQSRPWAEAPPSSRRLLAVLAAKR